MKTKTLVSFLAIGLLLNALGQNTLELSFTAIDNADYIQLNSVKVMNLTQGGDTVLYYPDTLLVLDYQDGISETNIGAHGFQVFQNYPNPVIGQTTISFYIPDRDKVSLISTDMLGRTLIKAERVLDQGYHSYRFTPGNGSLFLFTVQWRESSSSIKILRTNSVSKKTSVLEYIGREDSSPQLKSTVDIQSFLFNLGDTLLYIGNFDTLQSGILDVPEEINNYTFQFATNIPCPGTPTVNYEGQVYNTIQIFSQCWLKENLNVGILIPGGQWMSNDSIIEKYCYNDQADSCSKYGGLYQWNEMMQYTTQQGTQGICPPGWHLPTDEEFKVLEGAVDNQYGIGDTTWDINGIRGYDVGMNLKTTSGWYNNGNGTDLYGFSALPGGKRESDGSFTYMGLFGIIWASTEDSNLYSRFRSFANQGPELARGVWSKIYGHSVRCLRD